MDLDIIDSVISSRKVSLHSDVIPSSISPRLPELRDTPLTDLNQDSSPSAIVFCPPSAPSLSKAALDAPLCSVPSSTPPIVITPAPLFTEADFRPLPSSGQTRPLSTGSSPISPAASPSFADPSLKKSLNIFSDKTPLSPSILPLDLIRFEKVTIRWKKKSSKPPLEPSDTVQAPYTPISERLKATERSHSSPSPRVLRASTPDSSVS